MKLSRKWHESLSMVLYIGGLLLLIFSLQGCSGGGNTSQDIATHIAFVRYGAGGSDIYLKNTLSEAGTETNLTNNLAFRNTELAWSPEGTKIAFVSTRDGNSEIYVMNNDGSNVTRITNDPAIDMSPAWSPDGTKFAFISFRSGENFSVFTMKTDGTNVIQVTDNPGTDATPTWSPDSTRLAFTSDFDNVDGQTHIYLIDVDGTNQDRLTSDDTIEGDPDWGLSNNKLVYQRSDEASGSQIYSINSDGTGSTRITDGTPTNQGWHARWSPDGSELVFVSDRSGHPLIYNMLSNGTEVQLLTNTSAIDGQPAWGQR